MALTINLPDPVIWICAETGRPYDADTYEATYMGGESEPLWWRHTHTDGTVCEHRKGQ